LVNQNDKVCHKDTATFEIIVVSMRLHCGDSISEEEAIRANDDGQDVTEVQSQSLNAVLE